VPGPPGDLLGLFTDDRRTWGVFDSDADELVVWDLVGARRVLAVPARTMPWGPVAGYGFALREDGRRLAVVRNEHLLDVWSVPDGRRLHSLSGSFDERTLVALAPSGEWVCSIPSLGDLTLRSLRGPGAQVLYTQPPEHAGDVPMAIMVGSSGTYLYWTSLRLGWPRHKGDVQRLNVSLRRRLAPLRGHADGVFSLAQGPDEAIVLTGSRDRTIRAWDVRTGTTIRVFRGPTGDILSAGWSKDRSWLAAVCADKTLRTWDFESGALLDTVLLPVRPISLTMRGKHIYVACRNDCVLDYLRTR